MNVTCASNEWLEGDLFDDVQDAKTAEQNDPAFLREQNDKLSKELDKAVNALHMLRDGAVSEVKHLMERERNAMTRERHAYAKIASLKQDKRSLIGRVGALTRHNANARMDLEAVDYSLHLEKQSHEQTLEALREALNALREVRSELGEYRLLEAVRKAPRMVEKTTEVPFLLAAERD